VLVRLTGEDKAFLSCSKDAILVIRMDAKSRADKLKEEKHMEMRKMWRKHTSAFSLIEMLVVLLILAALVTQLLPTVNKSEKEINTVADEYNMAGTLRYLETFNALHNSYPTALHTGLKTNATTGVEVMDGISIDCLMAMRGGVAPAIVGEWAWDGISKKVYEGVGKLGPTALSVGHEVTVSEAASLKNAGIKSLTYGSTVTAIDISTGAQPANSYNDASGTLSDGAGTAANTDICIAILNDGAAANFSRYYTNAAANTGDLFQNVTLFGQTVNAWPGLLTPKATDTLAILYISADVDWDNYYASWTGTTECASAFDDKYEDSGESLISLKLPARSPYMSNGSWNYYMGVFALDNSLTGNDSAKLLKQSAPAKLVAVFSPGHLETLTP
jgi:prepilin-type N-terminal cleavage/methylation domain-containing protein